MSPTEIDPVIPDILISNTMLDKILKIPRLTHVLRLYISAPYSRTGRFTSNFYIELPVSLSLMINNKILNNFFPVHLVQVINKQFSGKTSFSLVAVDYSI